MNKNTKDRITKTQKYEMIDAILAETSGENVEMLREFVKTEQAALTRKAAKAKEALAEKKTELDELAIACLEALTSEPQTRSQVLEAISVEDATIAKVGARLSKLVDLNKAARCEVDGVTASGKKTTHAAYTLPQVEM